MKTNLCNSTRYTSMQFFQCYGIFSYDSFYIHFYRLPSSDFLFNSCKIKRNRLRWIYFKLLELCWIHSHVFSVLSWLLNRSVYGERYIFWDYRTTLNELGDHKQGDSSLGTKIRRHCGQWKGRSAQASHKTYTTVWNHEKKSRSKPLRNGGWIRL